MNKNKYKQMTKNKNNPNITKIKHRFGAFEIRLSEAKVEIEDYIHKQHKFIFADGTRIYAQFHYLLNDTFMQDGEVVEKSDNAEKDDLEHAERLVYVMFSTLELFSNASFLSDYLDVFSKTLESKEYKEATNETDEEIISNERTKHDAQEILKDENLRDTFLEAGLEY